MDSEDLEISLSLLMKDLAEEPEGSHEIFLRLHQVLAGMRAIGMPPPDDLVRLERELEAEFVEGEPV